MVEEWEKPPAPKQPDQRRGGRHANVAHDPDAHAAAAKRSKAVLDAVGEVQIGGVGRSAEAFRQGRGDRPGRPDAEGAHDVGHGLLVHVLPVDEPRTFVLGPRLIEGMFQTLGPDADPGVSQDGGPGEQPQPAQLPMVLEDEGIPIVERHGFDRAHPELRVADG